MPVAQLQMHEAGAGLAWAGLWMIERLSGFLIAAAATGCYDRADVPAGRGCAASAGPDQHSHFASDEMTHDDSTHD